MFFYLLLNFRARFRYKFKSLGYDFEKVVERVSILFQVEKDYITGRGRQIVVELGMPMGSRKNKFTFLALRFRLGLVDFKEQKAQ